MNTVDPKADFDATDVIALIIISLSEFVLLWFTSVCDVTCQIASLLSVLVLSGNGECTLTVYT